MSQPFGRRALRALVLPVAVLVAILLPGAAVADQASQPEGPAAGSIATGNLHSCALNSGVVRCWGYGGDGALGYGNTASIGDDEGPDAAGPVDLGPGRTAVAIAAGSFHTCALLDNGAVRCWGFDGLNSAGTNDGRLGRGDGSVENIGDDETPASIPPVNLGRPARAIAAGNGATCAILDDGTVRCWGFNLDGRLGYGHIRFIGDDEAPGLSGPVNLGAGRTAKAISTGGSHTCALLDNGAVRCWGFAGDGRLGYGKLADIARFPDVTPDTVGPVNLGAERTATAITAALGHTCAILDNGIVRCWGLADEGRLGSGNNQRVGDDEQPNMVPPVSLGRAAIAIHGTSEHTCVVLDDGSVRCWGFGGAGRLGYGTTDTIGDNEVPSTVSPVALGLPAIAISAGQQHTWARLHHGTVRCWGRADNGRVGYCNATAIGDDELPSTAGPVPLGQLGIPRPSNCPAVPDPPPPPPTTTTTPPPPPAPVEVVQPPAPPPPAAPTTDRLTAALAAERARARLMSTCLRSATRQRTAARRRANALVGARRRLQLRLANTGYTRRRAACVRRHGRLPGRVTELKARRTGAGKVELSFHAAGTDRGRAPAARNYLVKQSTRPIRTARDFARAAALCRGKCPFPELTSIHATVTLDVTRLVRNRLYYYAVAARDNVSSRVGPRSRTISIRAR